MPPSRKLEERLAAIHALAAGDAAAAPEAAALLREALRSKTGILVAAAAKIVGARPDAERAGPSALVDELAPAFVRLLDRPIERDPGCRGKIAIARALHARDVWSDDVFPRGVRHVQREPIWGGTQDTAAELRGVCGLAFAHAGHLDALDVLSELLADPERVARAAAAQALGDAGRPDATALLRYKALTGDEEPAVLGACFASLLVLAPSSSLPFVGRFLDESGDRAEAAALALGESKLEGALPLLTRFCEDSLPDVRARVGYLAIALLRSDPAVDYVLRALRTGPRENATAAGMALATFRDDPTIAARAREAAAANPDPRVREELGTAFVSRSAER